MLYRPAVQHLYDVERKRIASPANVTMRLQRLEKPEDWPVELLEKMWGSVPPNLLQQYSDYPPFYRKLAEFIGIGEDELVVGAGIEDFIRSLFWLCCDQSSATVAFTWPTCALFDLYSHVFNVEPVQVITNPYENLKPDVLISKLSPMVKLLLLPNPGQPVETHFLLDELRTIATYCQENDIVFAIDEAYYYFGAETALSLIHEFDNVLVLRTFSKAFGAASVRVGCAIGNRRVLKPLEAFRLSGEVTGPSMHAVSVLIDHFDSHVHPSIMAICEGRDWLREKIQTSLDFQCWGSIANHVLVDFKDVEIVRFVAKELTKSGIYIKVNFPLPLTNYALITCGSKPLMQKFFSALSDLNLKLYI